MLDSTVHPMSRPELGKAYHCTSRTHRTCFFPSKVWVDGRPYCLRCGRRAAKAIADINARAAELSRQIAEVHARWSA